MAIYIGREGGRERREGGGGIEGRSGRDRGKEGEMDKERV